MIRWFRRPRDLTCEQVAQLLQDYLDAEVERGTADKVSVHLGGCQHCGIEYGVYRQIKQSLVHRAQAPVDPAVLGDLRRFCDQLVGRDPTPPEQRW